MIIRRAALAAALTVGGALSGVAQTHDPARVAAVVDSLAAAALATGQIAGISVAVSLDGRPLVTKGYGYADLEWKVPTPGRAIYQIGSVTKQFTAAAILQLAERGKLDLDADITRYLPDYDTQGRKIPVRRLLDHTSGIMSYTSMPHFQEFGMRTLPRDTLVKLFSRERFLFEPGTLQVYNNSGFFLLGLIIEKVSGMPYAEYVKENLFERAGMRDSRYCSETEVVPGMTHGYDLGEKGLQHAAHVDHTWPYAAGSLCSTVADLDAWNRALHGGKILGADVYREMITPGALNDGSRLSYAKGIAVSDVGGRRIFHHGGDIPGFSTYLDYFPDDRLSVAVAINSMGLVRPADLARTIADLVLGTPAAPAPFTGRTADYTGEYRGTGGMGEELVVKIAAGPAGGLRLEGPLARQGGSGALVHTGGESFQLDDKRITFVRENGRVTWLHVDVVYVYLVLKRGS